jgi:hypothetical protein
MDNFIREFLNDFVSPNITVSGFYGFIFILVLIVIFIFLKILFLKWYEKYFSTWFDSAKYLKKIFLYPHILFLIISYVIVILVFVPNVIIELILPISNFPVFLDRLARFLPFDAEFFYFLFWLWVIYTVFLLIMNMLGLDDRTLPELLRGVKPIAPKNLTLVLFKIPISCIILLIPFYLIAIVIKLLNYVIL